MILSWNDSDVILLTHKTQTPHLFRAASQRRSRQQISLVQQVARLAEYNRKMTVTEILQIFSAHHKVS